jgi:hypothetical protein
MDHSEIMNYEFEQANKNREDHMNMLVYKSGIPSSQQSMMIGEKENSYIGGERMTSASLY